MQGTAEIHWERLAVAWIILGLTGIILGVIRSVIRVIKRNWNNAGVTGIILVAAGPWWVHSGVILRLTGSNLE